MPVAVYHRRLVAFVAFAIIAAAAGAAYKFANRPFVLTLAVGPSSQEDEAFASSLARALASSGRRDRISIERTSGPVQSMDRIKNGKVQLAIVRQEGGIPKNVRAIAMLHSDPIVVLAARSVGAKEMRDLATKRIGVIGSDSTNSVLLETLRNYYQGEFASVDIPPGLANISAALTTMKVDALFFVAPSTYRDRFSESLQIIRKAANQRLEFVPIDAAEAIAASLPSYQDSEISAGQFGGSPPLPTKSVDTLAVSTYLVADEAVDGDVIAELTQFLFEHRQLMVADAPVAAVVKAASTDKDAVIPIHPGAKVYFDSEEETWMDRYGDWLWIGPMLAGGLISAGAALWRFVGISRKSEYQDLLSRIPLIIGSIRTAASIQELDLIRAQVDSAVERISRDVIEGAPDDPRIGSVSIVITYLDRTLREKRISLEQQAQIKSASLV